MRFILFSMLVMILGSVLLEFVLPMRLKTRLGVVICWMMMFITMSFLVLSTVGLAFVIAQNIILPMFA
jgi:hypothetical protein